MAKAQLTRMEAIRAHAKALREGLPPDPHVIAVLNATDSGLPFDGGKKPTRSTSHNTVKPVSSRDISITVNKKQPKKNRVVAEGHIKYTYNNDYVGKRKRVKALKNSSLYTPKTPIKHIQAGESGLTAMNLVKCPACSIFIKADALDHHMQHNHKNYVVKRVLEPKEIIDVSHIIDDIKAESKESNKADNTKVIVEKAKEPIKTEEKKKRYFNKDVYRKAILKMTQSDAWKLATDEERCIAFLTKDFGDSIETHLHPIATGSVYSVLEAAEVITAPLEEPVEPAKPIKIKESLEALAQEFPLDNVVDVKATGRVIEITHKARSASDQASFRKRVLANFKGKCAVTGYALPVLEAAHIENMCEGQDMSTNNGLALEPTLHRLLDAGLMGIDPNGLTIHFAVECFHKEAFEGKTLQPHIVKLDTNKLLVKWKEFLTNLENSNNER